MDKASRIFPTLYCIDDFICQEHPKYHPTTKDYSTYWEEQEKLCLEGKWGFDSKNGKGGWRYMPGFLYYYINLSKIIVEDDLGATKISNPYLRDVEWMLSYGWLSARKFSGFELDTEFTCHRVVKKIEEKGEDSLTPKEKVLVKRFEKDLKVNGKYKKYRNAVKYLYETKEKPLGQPLYHNEALNFFVLGTRGFGKSFFCGNAVVGHEYNFFGKNKYDAKYLKNPSPVEIFVGSAMASKSAELLSKFSLTQEYLKTGPGSWGEYEDFEPGYFYNHHKGTLDSNNAKNPYRHFYDAKDGAVWRKKGTGTKIVHGIYTTENPQAAVGTRPSVMVIEEVGLLSNLLAVQGANETCQIRDTKFGSSFYIGTGGNMEKITEAKIVFKDAEAYNFVGYEDIWEGSAKPIGFFMPATYVDNTFKDEVGNTDVEASLKQEEHEREIRKKASSASALTEYIMARPLVPSEMFLTSQNMFFPVALLKERYIQLEREPILKSIGTLEYTDKSKKSVKWIPDNSLRPIEELTLKSDRDLKGAMIIYEHPPDLKPQFVLKRPLFKVTYDPVKDDEFGRSLASVLIYKGFVDSEWESEADTLQHDLVGEWIGRLDRVEDIHEIVIKAALYFGARVLTENNLPDFIRYCRIRGLYHILQPSPYEAISKIIKNPSKKYDVGVTMSSKHLNVQCELLINDILNEPWKEDIPWLYKLKSKRLLLELINYSREGNFDHVSAMKLLALWLRNDLEYKTYDPSNEEDRLAKWDVYASTILEQRANPFYVH